MCVLLIIKKKTGQRQWKLWARTHKYVKIEEGFNIKSRKYPHDYTSHTD